MMLLGMALLLPLDDSAECKPGFLLLRREDDGVDLLAALLVALDDDGGKAISLKGGNIGR